MTADEAACTGECRRQQSENTWDRDATDPRPDGMIVCRALDWPVNLFADTDATEDDDAPDGEAFVDEPSYGHAVLAASGSGDRGMGIARRLPAYEQAGVAP